MHVSVAGVVLAASVVGYVAFLLWYGGRGRAMDSKEADALLERVRSNARIADPAADPDLFESLRDVTRDDDGREFVMVNLIRYREKALYPAGYSYSDDPHAAEARYNRSVVPLLLKRGCLPVFLGRSAGRFLAPDGAEEWDCVVLVRYRSRRDLLGMCAGLARTRADIHKWAAIDKTHVFPVHVPFSLILIRLTVGGMFAGLNALAWLVLA